MQKKSVAFKYIKYALVGDSFWLIMNTMFTKSQTHFLECIIMFQANKANQVQKGWKKTRKQSVAVKFWTVTHN